MMKAWQGLVVGAWLAAPWATARNSAPLPNWSEAQRKAMEANGWLAGERILGAAADGESQPGAAVSPPDLGGGVPTAGLTAPQSPVVPVPEKFLTAYFDAKPEGFLIDPQGLLDEGATHEQLALLKAHAADSPIDLYIYIFAKDQEIPGEVRGEELCERCFGTERPSLLIFYFLGAPQQTVLYPSPSMPEAIPATEQRQALQSAIYQASQKASPPAQLEAFTIQLTKRIYRMEQMLHGISDEADGPKLSRARAAKLAKSSSSLAERWARWRPMALDLAIPGLLIASVLAASVGIIGWRRRRATYRFPELFVEPRLGGQHAAGLGAVIAFASADLPPASQRRQVAGYLRRT